MKGLVGTASGKDIFQNGTGGERRLHDERKRGDEGRSIDS